MVQCFFALARRLDEDGEILARLFLADEFAEAFGTQRRFQRIVLAALGRDDTVGFGNCTRRLSSHCAQAFADQHIHRRVATIWAHVAHDPRHAFRRLPLRIAQ
ncbi:MAG TPA: hypothetical protein VF410_04385, partial [Rhizomicrobium sp.]